MLLATETEEKPAVAGVMYRKYLSPQVANRLINYYASDEIYGKVGNALAIVEALPEAVKKLPELNFDRLAWYSRSDIYSPISGLVSREPTVRTLVDELKVVDPATGKTRLEHLEETLAGAFYNKISDLVSAHSVLVGWYAKPEVSNPLYNLISDSKNILDISKFVMGTTIGGINRWSILQSYLSDSMYGNVVSLSNRQDLISGLVDSLKSKADSQGISYSVMADRLGWLGQRFEGLKWVDDNRGWIQWLSDRSGIIQYVADKIQIIPAASSVTKKDMTRITTDLDLWDGTARRSLLAGYIEGHGLSLNGLDINELASTLKARADEGKMAWSDMANRLGWLGQRFDGLRYLDDVRWKIRDHLDFASAVSSSLTNKLGSNLNISWNYDFWAATVHFTPWWVDANGTPHRGGYSGTGREAFETWLRTLRWLVDLKTGKATYDGGPYLPLEDAIMVFVQGMRSVFSNFFDIDLDIRNWSDRLAGISRGSTVGASASTSRTRLIPSEIRSRIAEKILI